MNTKSITTVSIVAALLAMFQPAFGVPITGNIGFAGTVQLDSFHVATATKVVSWPGWHVSMPSGSFTNIANGTPVSLIFPWSFNPQTITNFCSVGNFNFTLTSSNYVNGPSFRLITFTGTVSATGFDPTPCTGSFAISDPSVDGATDFSYNFSFGATPAPPNLVINQSAGNMQISWPNWSNYTLQQNTNLNTTNWVSSSLTITNNSGTNYCTVILTNGSVFFRLKQ